MTVASTAEDLHEISISCELPSRGGPLVLQGGHRARCSCGWTSDCYAQISDTERAADVHLRRARRESFDGLLARSSIGAALADVKARGIDAHLKDLDEEMHPRKRQRKKPRLSTEDKAFMRGFGVAIAEIWRCHHDGQMVRHLVKENGFSLRAFRDVGLLDADYAAIEQALRRRTT